VSHREVPERLAQPRHLPIYDPILDRRSQISLSSRPRHLIHPQTLTEMIACRVESPDILHGRQSSQFDGGTNVENFDSPLEQISDVIVRLMAEI